MNKLAIAAVGIVAAVALTTGLAAAKSQARAKGAECPSVNVLPDAVRIQPAMLAPMPAPTMWAQNTQPKTMPESLMPKCWRHRATVGGTVATQSRP